jgi:hypothetical protein
MPRVHRERKGSEEHLPMFGEEFFWYLVMGHPKDELVAIMKSRTSSHVPLEDNTINAELGEVLWYLIQTTQAEFETYRAFGIKEIKL